MVGTPAYNCIRCRLVPCRCGKFGPVTERFESYLRRTADDVTPANDHAAGTLSTWTTIALVALLATGCRNLELPTKTFAVSTTPDLEPELDQALVGWEHVGLVRVGEDENPDIAPLRIERWATDDLQADGVALRNYRMAYVKRSLRGIRLRVILAHEIGHIILDTPEHNESGCGIMGGSSVVPCEEDYWIACDRVEIGCAGDL